MRDAITILCALALSACGDELTAFPAGLEPLDAVNQAARPATLDEVVSWARGEGRDHEWVHGRAFVKAPITETWKAFADPEVVIDRRAVDSYTVNLDVEPGFDESFVVHNTVHSVVTVDFDITWRQSAIEGEKAAPRTVAIRFQKTFGTVFITILRGSFLLKVAPEDESLTELEMIEHIDAAQGGADTIQAYLTDLFASVTARVHGRALPVYPDE